MTVCTCMSCSAGTNTSREWNFYCNKSLCEATDEHRLKMKWGNGREAWGYMYIVRALLLTCCAEWLVPAIN